MGEKYGAIWGSPAKMVPARAPPVIFAWTALEFTGGHGFAGNFGIFEWRFPANTSSAGNPISSKSILPVSTASPGIPKAFPGFPGGQRLIGKFVFLSNGILTTNECFPIQYGFLHFIASICACFVSSSAWVYRLNSL